MYKKVSFNIYKEHLEDIVFGEGKDSIEDDTTKEETEDKPIPKPPPQSWTDPLSYRRFNRESEGTSSIL
ncbi:MAG: hypothetical protein ACR2F2_03845 [Pyrinomonadaceae bacterium]